MFSSDSESAIVASLPLPDIYTAIVAGAEEGTGEGLVELYDLDKSVDRRYSQGLEDSTLEFSDSNGAVIASNDNCAASSKPRSIASGIQPLSELDSTILITLPPAEPHTAILRGKNGTTGLALAKFMASTNDYPND